MPISHSPLEFIRRHGLLEESVQPHPRLNLRGLRVHTVPISEPPLPKAITLQEYEGVPPPDRGLTRPWPHQLEEET